MAGVLCRLALQSCSHAGSMRHLPGLPVLPAGSELADNISQLVFVRNASKKAGGSSVNGRDSNPKNLGLKKHGGQKVIPGNIIVRQRGTRFHKGDFVGMGKDYTLYALLEGKVRFQKDKLTGRKTVHVDPINARVPVHPAFQGTKWEAALAEKGQQGIRLLLAEMKAAKSSSTVSQ